MEKQRTNSDPCMKSTAKHSIYPRTGGEGGGKGAGQRERGGANQEPGAVVPHAGICAGGVG